MPEPRRRDADVVEDDVEPAELLDGRGQRWSTRRRPPSTRRTDRRWRCRRPPRSRRTVSLARSRSRSAHDDLAPSSAKRSAEARPTPDPAPVMTADLALEQHRCVTPPRRCTSRSAPVGHASTAVRTASIASLGGSRTTAFVSSSCANVPGAYTMHIPLPMHSSRSTTTDQACPASGMGRHRRLGRREAVEPLGVAPEDLVLRLGSGRCLDQLLAPRSMQSGQVESECG